MPVSIHLDELGSIVRRIVIAAGTPEAAAETVTEVLIGAHLAGHDSHGVQHLAHYVSEIGTGEILPAAVPSIISVSGAHALVRGNWAWGHVTCDFAMSLAIDLAKEHGIALVGAVEVNHIGRLGHYVEGAAERGVVALMVTGGQGYEHPVAAPFGGAGRVLAPNPFAMGFPSADGDPVLVDFATTQAAGGKVELAKATGQSVPLGWIIDSDGQPTTDPHDFTYAGAGALLPFGEHKGFGVMVAAEILGRVLSGADAYADTPHGGVYFRHCGVTIIAIDAAVFSTLSEFTTRTQELGKRIRAVEPAAGFSDVQVPGDYEARTRRRRTGEALTIPDSTWAEIESTAAGLGIRDLR
jgi:LDH2 family malate/lactate/ureidoglycolate dehydrogenase